MGEYKSRKHVSAEFTFDSEWFGNHEFKELCQLERLFILPDMSPGGEGKREACKLTLVHEMKEYTASNELGSKELYEITWRVTAPEWRLWSLMERLDAKGIHYETDFGLIVE